LDHHDNVGENRVENVGQKLM